ncbi:MAG: hypothetical protein WCK41_10585 [Actinomycetes bacterium]
MNHVRIATYDVLHGVVGDVVKACLEPGGMAEIFQAQPGFQAYSVLEVDPVTLISVTVWETHDEAEAAVRQAAEWVAKNLDGRIHRTDNRVGEAAFWKGVAR